jgi:hypothetical protein
MAMGWGIKLRNHRGGKKLLVIYKSKLLLVPAWHFRKAEENNLELIKTNKKSM